MSRIDSPTIRLTILNELQKDSKMLYTDLFHVLCEGETKVMSNKTLSKYLRLLQKEERIIKDGHYYKLTKLGEKTLLHNTLHDQLKELSISELNVIKSDLSASLRVYNPEIDFPKILELEPLINVIIEQENLSNDIRDAFTQFFDYLKK